jgi:hypothetical protein
MPRSVINSGFGFSPLNFGGADSLDSILAKERSLGFATPRENRERKLTEAVFAVHPLTSHADKRITQIIDGIRSLNLPLKLYAGEAGYEDPKLKNEKLDIWKLTNGNGYEFQFVIQSKMIHAIWLIVEVEKQGFFWKVKRFFEQVADLLLEKCDYSFIYGQAVWTSNSRIKALPEKPEIEKDWRWLPVFCGWDASLKPIVYEGLLVFYFRMGFILHPKHGDENYVA